MRKIDAQCAQLLGVLCCVVGLVGCSPTVMEVAELNTSIAGGEDAEEVARIALNQLCSFSPQELNDGTVVDRIQDFVHPDLWATISANPSVVVPEVPRKTKRRWESTGGATNIAVAVSGEQHPPDTATSWSRKMDCERSWSGFSEPFVDVYLVVVTQQEGSWLLQRLQLI